MQFHSLAEMWRRAEDLHANRVAIVYDGVRRDYQSLIARAHKLGRHLHRIGVRRGGRVAMLSMNRAEWCDFYACCEICGFVATTVNFRNAPPEILFVLQDAAPAVVIFEARYAEVIESLKSQLPEINHYICLDLSLPWAASLEEVIASESSDEPSLRVAPDDAVHMIYTSGTTGRPKGVVRSQRAALALAAACATSQRMRVNGRMLLTMPMFHVGAQSMASGQHLMGGSVVLHASFEPAEVARTIQAERIQITHMAPTLVQRFLDEPLIDTFDLSSLETLCYAAAPMPVPVLRRGIARLGSIFLNCYGATECGNVAVMQEHLHRPDGDELEVSRLGSVGRAHLFSTLAVLDDEGLEVSRGIVGELCVRSDSMMTGYWNRSSETLEALSGGWYRTGDVARMDDEGFVFLVDRKKDMIISGGENIYCREVEEALLSHPHIAEAAVIGIPHEHWGEAVKAVLVAKLGDMPLHTEIVEHCRSRIAGYKIPRVIEYVAALPLLTTGKVNKVALRNEHKSRSSVINE
jgi:acyl-CoA synthetase (AMP-forming)/AMP-acid ligase II